jgi:hypothetical protein
MTKKESVNSTIQTNGNAELAAPVVQLVNDCQIDNPMRQSNTMPLPKIDPSASSFISRVQSVVPGADLVSEEEPICPSIYGAAIVKEVAKVKNLHDLTRSQVECVVKNNQCGLILKGTPGLGKTFIVKDVLTSQGFIEYVDYVIIKGHITGAKLYQVLWKFRQKGKIVVLDDCDTLFADDIGLTVLKAALDPDVTTVSYETTRVPIFNGVETPSFNYEGTLIVCTNVNLRTGNLGRRSTHLSAIHSRALVWPVLMSSIEAKFANVFYMLVERGYLDQLIDSKQKRDLLDFIWKHKGVMVHLDLRDPQRIAHQMKNDPTNWIASSQILVGATND